MGPGGGKSSRWPGGVEALDSAATACFHPLMASELDNPFWSSLQTRHGALAWREGEVARYPPQFAPFLGVSSANVDVGGSLASLVEPGESVLLLGMAPARVPDSFQLEAFADLAQMTCTEPLEVIDGPEIIELSEAHRED